MNKSRLIALLITFSCFALLFQGCGKSKIVTSWLDENKTEYQIEKVLVIAVFKDPITQKIYETSFVNLLKKAGVEAIPGSVYRLGPDEPHQNAITSALTQTGANSVLITHVLSNTTKTYTVAPMVDNVSYFSYWNSAYGYHSYVYEQTFSPAETIEKRHERMSVTLFDAATNKPVWSAISDSVNFEERLRIDDEELERLFINDMKKKKLL